MPRKVRLHQYAALTVTRLAFKLSTVDGRKGSLKSKDQAIRSRLGDLVRRGDSPKGQTRKNRLTLRGVVGVWNCESSDCIKGRDGARIHATNFLAGAGG